MSCCCHGPLVSLQVLVVYHNEEVIGEGLKPFVQAGRRRELFLVSKVPNDYHQAKRVR